MGVSAPWEVIRERTEIVGCSKCICDTWFCVWFPSLPKIHVTFPSPSAPNSPRTVSPWASLKSEQSHYSPFTLLWGWYRFEHHHGMGLQKQRGGEWQHRGHNGSVVLCCGPHLCEELCEASHTLSLLLVRGDHGRRKGQVAQKHLQATAEPHILTSLFFHADLNHSAYFRCPFDSFALGFWLWFILYI